MSELTMIVARAHDGVIGRDGGIPWRVPEDLRRFKELTWESFLVMGRKTFQSIGAPLPGRTSIVITSQKEPLFVGPNPPIQVPSLEAALDRARNSLAALLPNYRVFVIGGAEVYRAALPYVTRIELTEINLAVSGDVRLDLDLSGFCEVARVRGANPLATFVTLVRA